MTVSPYQTSLCASLQYTSLTAFVCCAVLPQYEATKAYLPKAPDELSLQQAEVVIVLQEVEGQH